MPFKDENNSLRDIVDAIGMIEAFTSGNLVRVGFRKRSAENREILREQVGETAVDVAETSYESVTIDDLGFHAGHAEKYLELIAGEVGEHQNLRDPMKRQKNADAISEENRGDRSHQAGKAKSNQTCMKRFRHHRYQNADR